MPAEDRAKSDIERCVAFDPKSVVVPRHPIEFEPASATFVNHARLPEPSAVADMALAHRERTPEDDLASSSLITVTMLPSALFLLLLLGFSVTRFIPPPWTIMGAAAITLALLVRSVMKGRITLRAIATALFLPPSITIAAYAVSALVDNRLLITAILGTVTIAAFLFVANKPTTFLWGWLNAHPRLDIDARSRLLTDNPLKPTLWVPIAAVLIAMFVPLFSTSLAVLAIVVMCLVVCFRNPAQWPIVARAPQRLGLYLSYGAFNTGVPGIWTPSESTTRRLWQFRLFAVLLFFSLGFGLRYYFPTDLIRGQAVEQLTLAVPEYPVLRDAFPGVDWTQLPPPDPAGARLTPPELMQPSPDPGARIPGEEARIERLNAWRMQQYQQALSDDAEFRQRYRVGVASEFVDKEIGDRPYTWVVAAAAGIVAGAPYFAWTFPAAFVIALLVPNLVLLATYKSALVNAHAHEQALDDTSSERWANDARTPWQWRVDRLMRSTHTAPDPLIDDGTIQEADHLFMGVEPYRSFPVLLDRSILNQHCYIVGETGSGKTSLGLMPLFLQLIQTPRLAPSRGQTEPRDDEDDDQPPIVILDIKGDPALFNLAKEEAEKRRARNDITDPKDPRYAFRFFTPEPNRASQYFNPFRSMQSKNRSVMQLAELLMESLSLAHGEGYGRSYYTRKAREQLLTALNRDPQPASLEELYDLLRDQKGQADTYELVATIAALAMYDNLASDDKRLPEQETIHMPTALEHRQVVYFWLPAATESVSVREIGKLALYSLLTAAIDRDRDSQPKRDTYLFIDEFQRIAGENFKIVLEQARSFGLHAILANQSLSDLKTDSADLRPTIQTNTRAKMYFTVSDPAVMKDLSYASGEEMMTTESIGFGYDPGGYWGLVSQSYSPMTKPRLTAADILRSSDHPLEFILRVSQGSGYTQFGGTPIPVQSPWPISFDEYKRLAATPWPERTTRQPRVSKEPKQIEQEAHTEKRTRMGTDLGNWIEQMERWSGAGRRLDDEPGA